MSVEAGPAYDNSVWSSRRLWSLLDMMNFVLSSFTHALRMVDEIETASFYKTRGAIPLPLTPTESEWITNKLNYIESNCKQMALTGALNRIERIRVSMNIGTSYAAMANEMPVLRQAIDDDVKFERFYHYPKDLGELKIKTDTAWAKTLAAFPSPEVRFEIHSGMDCLALGHPTAAIFHFMRVAEFGLRALARERKIKLGNDKPLEWGTWNELILKIEKAAKDIAQTKRAGPKKDAALNFYSGAVANFNGFKDQYRNSTMHVRKAYEPEEGAMAMRKVRDFMNELSAKIGESTKGAIKW